MTITRPDCVGCHDRFATPAPSAGRALRVTAPADFLFLTIPAPPGRCPPVQG